MSYSGGLPALYPVGFLNFFILYWAYKILLLKHYKKTTAFDDKLPIMSMNKFRVALVLHIAFSLFMFSNSNILSAKNLKYIQWVQDELVSYTKKVPIDVEHFLERWTSGVGLLYFLFVLFLVLAWVAYTFALKTVHKVFSALLYIICCGGQSKREADDERDQERKRLDDLGLDAYSNNILEDYTLTGL
jgi:hypothetical protein